MAMKKGMDVLLEKPMAPSLEELIFTKSVMNIMLKVRLHLFRLQRQGKL